MSKKVKDTDEDIIEAFRVFDPYNKGSISIDDIKKTLYFAGCHLNMSEIKHIVRFADCDGDGTVTYEGKSTHLIYMTYSFFKWKMVKLTDNNKH